ncbi:MAG: hypothetical protein ACI85U_002025 [Candidatus Promineifilaceae bacterium]|jgi:hypothetical protein
MNSQLNLLDVVALTVDVPEENLLQGEIGTIVECYPNDGYEVEFVAQDGFTYALVTLRGGQLMTLKQKKVHSDRSAIPAAI